MITAFKNRLYFPVAWYFRFFASIRLSRWRPRIIVITGSSGKTTFLHLVESQLGELAKYSHHANSSYGIPFDILGLHRINLTKIEWITLFLLTPLYAFKTPPKENIYIVEVDCDRPHEGEFLGSLLNPEIVMWGNVSRTHTMNFDFLVKSGRHENVEEAIAYEFGRILPYAKNAVFINADSPLIVNQLAQTQAEVVKFQKKGHLQKYSVEKTGTKFIIGGKIYEFDYLLPENTYYAIVMTIELARYLDQNGVSFTNFNLPPGRSSIFPGIKNTTLIDSSYNSNLDSATAILDMYDKIKTNKKWVVLGDMLEQGEGEIEEHEKLAERIVISDFDHIILIGPRVKKFTYPKLKELIKKDIPLFVFDTPKQVLDYLQESIKGGETILIKASQTGFYLEGVIEHLLLNKGDVNKLCRREQGFAKARLLLGL